MASPYVYQMRQVLADITVTALTPSSTHTTTITGTSPASDTSGSSQITRSGTQNVITTTALSGLLGDFTDLVFAPPIAAAGTFPDVFVAPLVDGIDMTSRMNFDASAPGNMMPSPANTVGQRHIRIGIPYREAVQNNVKNLPLKATGIKYSRQLQFKVTSAAGWATTDQPLRIIALGDLLDAQALTTVAAQGYSGSFSDAVPGFAPISGNHVLPGGFLTAGTWTALPNGNAQGATKVFRFFRQSSNAQATTPSGVWALSSQGTFGGQQGYVTSDNYDLGFDATSGQTYTRFLEAGIRPGLNNVFWGVKVNDTVLPSGQGIVATANLNLNPYGNVQPQRSSSNEYYALPRNPFPVVAYKNKLAFFIEANGTAIPAGATAVAVGGIQIETGNAA